MNRSTAAFLFAFALAAASAARGDASSADPTVPTDELARRLERLVADSPAMRMQALVVGSGGAGGVALLGESPETSQLVRAGTRLDAVVDGMKVEVSIRAVSPEGVEIATGDGGGMLLSGTYSPLPAPHEPQKELIRHMECANAPLERVMRMISDQTGVNIALSGAAQGKSVSMFLRNVDAGAAVEEICRSSNLWFRRERAANMIRVMTMDEYAESLNTFREEATEMFTLLYPNVIEVAAAIYGLYPDRTFLSLGEEEFEDDAEYDLSRRFRRFRTLEENGGSQFMSMDPPQASSSGMRSGSGVFSFSRGSSIGRMSQWDELRRRSRRTSRGAADASAQIAYDDAGLVESAYASGETNLADRVRSQATASSANIFVSLSRKNNILIVRTSDSRVMDEIRAMVKRLDVPTPMVLMEVKVLELSVDDNYEASFTYSFNRGTHSLGHNGTGADNVFADVLQSGQNAFNPTFAFKAVSDNITAQIKLMQEDGKVKTLATPTLLVANNEVARIFSGKQYPLVSGWNRGDTVVSDSGIVQGTTTVEITKEDVGTMLLITPNINADKTVTLRLLQENSVVSPDKVAIPVDGSGGESRLIEYVESRSLAGTFVANDGMTIMAGGLVKEVESDSYWRTPLLGSLPLVGWMFRGVEKVKERTELIVLIKPHVILTPLEGGRISDDVMKALSAHPSADGRASMGTHKPDAAADAQTRE